MRRRCDLATRAAVARGFTLIELIAVMVITAVAAGTTAVFLRLPLAQYTDAERRASIADAADTAFARMKRDLQRALPNSVRVTSVGSVYYLEFLSLRTAGRYRADLPSAVPATGATTCPDADGDNLANDNVLQFGVADTCFTTIGAIADFSAVDPNWDWLVVYNLGPGFTNADAYASGNATGGNKSRITGRTSGSGGEDVIQFQSNTFNLESPGHRFHVVFGPVTYACDPTAGTLSRFGNYTISAAQPTPPAGGSALLAKDLNGCTITYDQNVNNQRMGVVSIALRFNDTGGAGTVNLFQQIQVSNEP